MSIKVKKETPSGAHVMLRIEDVDDEIIFGNEDYIIRKSDWLFVRNVIDTIVELDNTLKIPDAPQTDKPPIK